MNNAKLAQLQGRDSILVTDPMDANGSVYRPTTEQEKSDMSIHYQAHEADPVSGLVGMNSSTGGTTKDGNNWGIIKEATNALLGKETTAHNCYSNATERCVNSGLLNDGKLKWEAVYNPKTNKDN